jgi:hypothetical protein
MIKIIDTLTYYLFKFNLVTTTVNLIKIILYYIIIHNICLKYSFLK